MHVSFNQDASCCIVGTSDGFHVYNCSPFGRFHTSENTIGIRGVGLAKMLFSTSLVVTVGNSEQESPRKLSVVNTRRSAQFAILCELMFPTTIRAVRLNRQRLVVVLDTQIYIYNIANMKLIHTLDTVLNRGGVSDITPTGGKTSSYDTNAKSHPLNTSSSASTGNWLVYPAGPPLKHHLAPPSTAGEAPRPPQGDVVIFDLDSLSPVGIVRAHRSPLSVLALNEDGTLLATTSDRGTLIRVFSIPSGTLLYEFRRGSYQSRVFGIAFSLGSKLLCVSSATQTVHIYKLDAAHRVKSVPYSDLGDTADTIADTSLEEDGSGHEATPEHQSSAVSENDDIKPSPSEDAQRKKSKSSWFSRSKWTDAARVNRSNSKSRDFAWFKLPLKQNTRTVLGLAPLSNLLYVASENGKLFHYAIDLEKGGECRKVAEYDLT